MWEAKIRINTKINMRNYWEGNHTITESVGGRALENLRINNMMFLPKQFPIV